MGISNQKVIITSRNDCDKAFYQELVDGYTLYRLKRLGLNNDKYEYYTVIPTKDIGFEINEYIETNNKIFIKIM